MSPLRTVSAVLGRCFLLCVALQVLALGMLWGLHDWAYGIHSSFFPSLTVEAFDLNIYQMLTLLKTVGLVLFLIPWAAVKLVMRRENGGNDID